MNNALICIPIVSQNISDYENILKNYNQENFDIIEIRLDYIYDHIQNLPSFHSNKKIIATLRTKNEGSHCNINDEEYLKSLKIVCQHSDFDYIDIEYSWGDKIIKKCISYARENHKKIILSSHHFEKTPENRDIKKVMKDMDTYDIDYVKYACMPLNNYDVIRFMKLSHEIKQELNHDIITMSMGELGMISRVLLDYTNSKFTFACLNKVSAPGQIELNKLKELINNE